MTKTDDLLKGLEETVSNYIKTIGEFIIKNEKFHIVDHYRSSEFEHCQICPQETAIKDIYVIEDSKGNRTIVGNVCITSITNEKIGQRFKDYQRKFDVYTDNRTYIDFLNGLLTDYYGIDPDNEEPEEGDISNLPIWISKQGISKLLGSYKRLCRGISLIDTQLRLIQYYAKKIQKEISEAQQ